MPVAIRLQKQYADQISVLDSADIDTVSPILRVGGKLGTFGDDAIENVRIGNRTAECDLVLAPRNWSEMTEAEIEHLVKPCRHTANWRFGDSISTGSANRRCSRRSMKYAG